MAKRKKKVFTDTAVEKKFAELGKKCEELAIVFITHPKISKLITPYMLAIRNTREAMAWLKILASILFLDKNIREGCVKEVFKEEADFLLMYSKAIEAIIEEDLSKR